MKSSKLYVDLPSYLSPCTVTNDSFRPNIILSTADNVLYIIKVTMGFDTNLNNNARRKELRYRPLLTDLANDFQQIKSIYLSISSLGIFGNCSYSFPKLCMERGEFTNGFCCFFQCQASEADLEAPVRF